MLSKLSVKKPYTVLVGVVLVIVLGVVALTRMTTDLLPNMNLPYALVVTTDVGASPEEVEKDVTAPIEAAMATTSNIKNVSSYSYDNYSMVVLEYEQTANMDSVLIEMQQELDQLDGSWPDTVGTPIIMQIDPDMMPVMIASAGVEGLSESEIATYVDNELIPSLESIEGVASVTATGELEENIQVTMEQEKIDALNETIKSRIEAQFDEAQEELDASAQKIEDGQAQLAQGQSQLENQISEASNQIVNNKMALYATEGDIASQQTLLETSKQVLIPAIHALEDAYDQATKIQTILDRLESLRTADSATISAALDELEAQTGITINRQSDVVTLITFFQGQLNNLNASLQNQGIALQSQGITITDYLDIPAALSTLRQAVVQVNEGIVTIQEAQEQIDAGKVTLDEAYKALNKSQISGILSMSAASAQLADAAVQLAAGQQQLDATRESTLEETDLNQILSLSTLQGLLVAQNFSMPAGYVTKGDEQYLVRVGDTITSVEDLNNLVLIDLGLDDMEPIRLCDVATVEVVNNADETYSKLGEDSAVMLSIEKQTGYSTGDVTDRVLERFESLEKNNSNLHLGVLMNQGIYIDIIVQSVLENMIVGAILAILVLILFMKDIKPTIVIACAIPLSVIFAIVLMYFSDISLNIISLSGLALGIGMLVDNSIVVIENIYRLRNEGYSIKKAAVEGASQVTGAIIASTLTTVCVFAPIIFTDGITRQLFVDIALTIAFTLAASLLVALTFVPAMAAGLLKNTKEIKHNFMEKVKELYGKVLEKLLHFKIFVFLFVIVLLVVSVLAAFSRGYSFMDMNMETNQLTVTVGPKQDESLSFEELTSMSDEVIQKISQISGVKTIGAMTGGNNMMSLSSSGSDTVTMYLILDEEQKVTSEEITNQVMNLTKDMDCQVSADSSASDFSSFFGNGISVQIKGSDLDTLQELAAQISEIVENTEGTTNIEDGLDDVTPSFTVSVDKEKAAEYGMTVAQVYQLIYGKMASATSATTIAADLKDYAVYVESAEQSEITLQDIRTMTFSYTNAITGEEQEVPLSRIADFSEGSSLNSISRDAQTRYLSVTAGIDEDHNVSLVSTQIQKELDKLELPDGYSVAMVGEDETINEAMSQLYLMLILAVIFIYLIMVAQFQSLLSPFIIMFTIPLAFTGGFLALFLTGNEISVISMIGFVMLAGIIVNNGIVMVDYINQRRRQGLSKKDAIIESGKTRLRPILMTALTTILAMSTMALGMGSGSEMMQPMAIVTVGGLLYGTLLTLIVVPCIYDAFNREKNMLEEEL